MKKFTKHIAALILVLTALVLGVSADGVYSSQSDPLVSLSYVNDVLAPEIMSQVMAKIEKEYVKISDITSANAGLYTQVTLKRGQTLMAASCCEMIALDGDATVTVTSAANIKAGAGINDLTGGTVLTNGTKLPINRYLVVPKPDGRGFTVTSATMNILVRGEYNIAG